MTQHAYYDNVSLEELFNELYSLRDNGPKHQTMLLGSRRQVDSLMRLLRPINGSIRLEAIDRPPECLAGEIVIDPEAEAMNPGLAERRSEIRAATGGHADILEFRLSRFGVSHDDGTHKVSRSFTKRLTKLYPRESDEGVFHEMIGLLKLSPRSIHAASLSMSGKILETLMAKERFSHLREMPLFTHVRGEHYSIRHGGIAICDFFYPPSFFSLAQLSEFQGLGAGGTLSLLLTAKEFLAKSIKLMSRDMREDLGHLLEIDDLIAEVQKAFPKDFTLDLLTEESVQRMDPLQHEPPYITIDECRRYFATNDIPPPPDHVLGHMAFYSLPQFLTRYYELRKRAAQPIAERVEQKFGELVRLYEHSRGQPEPNR